MSTRVVIPAVAIAVGSAVAFPVGCGSNPPVKCKVESATGINGDSIARYTVLSVSNAQACANYQLPQTPPASTPDGGTAYSGANENPIPWYNSNANSLPLGVESYTPNPEDSNYASELYSMALKAEWIGVRIQDAQNPTTIANCTACPVEQDGGIDLCPACPIGAGISSYPYASASAAPNPPPNGTPSTNFPYAWGQFASVYPDPNGICHVADMSSSMTYPDVPEHMSTYGCAPPGPCTPYDVPDQPATKVEYDWTNLRSFVSATTQGVQIYGNLSITQSSGTQPPCTIKYSVSILTPRVTCGSTTDTDSNGMSLSGDQAQCDPNPNGANNLYGSGISEFITPVCTNVSNDPTATDFECLPPTTANDPNSTAQ